jgi:plasmid replication initiation protein
MENLPELDRLDSFSKSHSTQSNDLIRSAYSMTLNEKKLLLKAMSKIDSFNPISKDGCIIVELTIDECRDMFNEHNIWRELSNATGALQNRTVTLYPEKDVKEEVSWVDLSRYFEKESKVQIKFGSTISKKLTDITEKFTQIELLDVARFKSVHSIRLYELLKQVENKKKKSGWLKITLSEFRLVMGLEGKYKVFSTLNIRVIEPAIKELNRTTLWSITVERIKKGKSVHMLHFEFKAPCVEPIKIKTANQIEPNDKKGNRAAITASIMDIHDTNW